MPYGKERSNDGVVPLVVDLDRKAEILNGMDILDGTGSKYGVVPVVVSKETNEIEKN